MSKKKILEYLQKNAMDLRRRFPSLIDARYEAKPARMVLIFDSTPAKIQNFAEKLDFKVEIKVEEVEIEQTVAGEDENLSAWKKRHKGVDFDKQTAEEVKDVINPNSKSADKVGAYEAWKKRHSSVKVR